GRSHGACHDCELESTLGVGRERGICSAEGGIAEDRTCAPTSVAAVSFVTSRDAVTPRDIRSAETIMNEARDRCQFDGKACCTAWVDSHSNASRTLNLAAAQAAIWREWPATTEALSVRVAEPEARFSPRSDKPKL